MKTRRITLKDVARESGVAVSTVSSILNKRPDNWASEATRKRVFDASARLGFRPNKMARSLRGKNFDLVLASAPRMTNPFFAELASGIRRRLSFEGLDLTVEETDFHQQRYTHLLDGLPGRSIDGAILVTSAAMESDQNFPRAAAAVPLVLLGAGLASTACCRVECDISNGLQQAILHLRDLGHGSVGMMDCASECPDAANLFELMTRISGELGMRIRPEWHVRGGGSLDQARENARVWATRSERNERPGALVCTNDMTAIACIRGLGEAGLRVPEDISVIGIDGIQIAEMLPRRLTTIAQPIEEMVARAVHLLLGRIRGGFSAPPSSILLPCHLRLGETTGPAPAI